jgi:uncharacterized membrane-anchored protein
MNDYQSSNDVNVPYSDVKTLLNKVPEITLYFWIIKILCTTVGETAADFLNINLNFGLTGTSIVTGILLAVALFFQFRSSRYIPGIYWVTVVLISVFGTLVTDNLTDAMGVPLETSTILFSVLLGATFLFWYIKEKTLSVHTIFTKQRELFYWLAILFTFALGTASGDLMAEGLGLGYLLTGIIVAGAIALFAVAWRIGLNPILGFWLIYILTRPFGASIGDFLSQPANHGGLNLGATVTSVVFLLAILGTVIYLTLTKKDVIDKKIVKKEIAADNNTGGLMQVVVTLGLIALVSVVGYQWRSSVLFSEVTSTPIPKVEKDTSSTSTVYPLGDVSELITITQDSLDLVNQGKLSEATTRIADLEYEWDNAQAKLKPMNKAKWTEVDDAIDAVLRQLRARNVNAETSKSALIELLTTLK